VKKYLHESQKGSGEVGDREKLHAKRAKRKRFESRVAKAEAGKKENTRH
jgi:hypothetical protein